MGLFKKQKTDFNKNIFEGSSIQQALNNAAEALKVPQDQISYDVISYGSTGVFGLVGNKRAKIRVRSSMRIKEKALSATEKYWREIQDEQEKFATKELHKEKQVLKSKKDEPKPDTAKANIKAQNNKRKPRPEKEMPAELASIGRGSQAEAAKENPEKNIRRQRPQNQKRAPKNTAEKFISDEAFENLEIDVPQAPLTGQLKMAHDVLRSLSESLLDDPFQILYTLTDKKISFIVKGENLSALIGKNGNTRRSLQLLADRIINKGGQGKYDVNLIVDTVRQNKSKRILISLAKRKADQCRKTQEEISLGFMNAYERCVIHIALKKDPDVETKSVGDDAKKEIFIIPVNQTKNKPASAENKEFISDQT